MDNMIYTEFTFTQNAMSNHWIAEGDAREYWDLLKKDMPTASMEPHYEDNDRDIVSITTTIPCPSADINHTMRDSIYRIIQWTGCNVQVVEKVMDSMAYQAAHKVSLHSIIDAEGQTGDTVIR